MKKKIPLITIVLFIGLIMFIAAYSFTENEILYSMAITFGTTFYHFAMRLAVGYAVNSRLHNHVDYTKKWFQQRSFEPKFYEAIRVKKWKRHIPSYNPTDFLLEKHSVDYVIQATCQSEIVHEIIMVLSFVPVLFSVWFGAELVFLITSCISFVVDGVFVILQRYNRPRLIKLMKRTSVLSA